MKKDKEWLKEKVQAMIDQEYRCYDPLIQQRKHTCRIIMDLIDQLEEPQKPVIPQFVADWIEEERAKIIDWHTEIPERFFLILGHKLNYTTLASTNIGDWFFGGNEEKLYQALKYGYEVEKEKKYHIKFSHNQYACRFNEEAINSTLVTKYDASEFTEAEIKAIDGRLMVFAQEVTE